jgi:hypothetical protein
MGKTVDAFCYSDLFFLMKKEGEKKTIISWSDMHFKSSQRIPVEQSNGKTENSLMQWHCSGWNMPWAIF